MTQKGGLKNYHPKMLKNSFSNLKLKTFFGNESFHRQKLTVSYHLLSSDASHGDKTLVWFLAVAKSKVSLSNGQTRSYDFAEKLG